MDFGDKDIKRFSIIALILALGVIVFLIVKPVFLAIAGGMILAYVFLPLHRKILLIVREKNTSAAIVSFITTLILLVPLWFLIPYVVQQIFGLFKFSQSVDVQAFINLIFPGASDQFVNQVSISVSSVISRSSSYILNYLVDFFIALPNFLLNLFLVAFVFFYALRDWDKFKDYLTEISPFGKEQEKVLAKQFSNIVDSLVYGQIIIGIMQGVTAGLGFMIFGVENALILTILAIVFSIIPFIGPSIVWIPASIYIFATKSLWVGVAYLVYNLLIVSTLDNILRSYIVSRKADISAVIILIGMIGGFFVFGLMGLLLGPLALAYLIVLLKAYKEKTLSKLFS